MRLGKLVALWPLPESGGDPLYQAFLYPKFLEVANQYSSTAQWRGPSFFVVCDRSIPSRRLNDVRPTK